MDLFLEDADGTFREHKGVCGRQIPFHPNLKQPWFNPCRRPDGHTGRHESLQPRRVYDTVIWQDPDGIVSKVAPDGAPRTIEAEALQ